MTGTYKAYTKILSVSLIGNTNFIQPLQNLGAMFLGTSGMEDSSRVPLLKVPSIPSALRGLAFCEGNGDLSPVILKSNSVA